MNTWKLLLQIHHAPGSIYYEIAIGVIVVGGIVKMFVERERVKEIIDNITRVTLGLLTVEAFMDLLDTARQFFL